MTISYYAPWYIKAQRPHHFVRVALSLGHQVQIFSPFGARFVTQPVPQGAALVRRPYLPRVYEEWAAIRWFNATSIGSLIQSFCHSRADLHVYGTMPVSPLPRAANVLYDCLDDWSAYPGAPSNIGALQEELCRSASQIWVTSNTLYQAFTKRYAMKLVLVPNGVEFSHFAGALALRQLRSTVARPVLVYMGALCGWFDASLVSAVARLLPEWRIVLIGRQMLSAQQRSTLCLPNVSFLGYKPYSALPALLAAADVAMIPFTRCALTDGTDPVKLYEYLAAGLPVVSTPMPEVMRFCEDGVVSCSASAETFAAQVKRLLTAKNPSRCQEIAAAHTWHHSFAPALLNSRTPSTCS